MRRLIRTHTVYPDLVTITAKGSSLTRARIILAEDYPEMAQQLRALLDTHYDVRVVPDGQALIAAADQEMPDIIISDIKMPGLDGLAAALNIRAKRSDVPFVFVSVRDDPGVIRTALAQGASGYVVKCDAGEELADAVEAVLSGDKYVSTAAQRALRSEP